MDMNLGGMLFHPIHQPTSAPFGGCRAQGKRKAEGKRLAEELALRGRSDGRRGALHPHGLGALQEAREPTQARDQV